MNIPGFSTNGLLMMHASIIQALAIDDNIVEGNEKIYGVRDSVDWRQHADAIELELNNRSVNFSAITW